MLGQECKILREDLDRAEARAAEARSAAGPLSAENAHLRRLNDALTGKLLSGCHEAGMVARVLNEASSFLTPDSLQACVIAGAPTDPSACQNRSSAHMNAVISLTTISRRTMLCRMMRG